MENYLILNGKRIDLTESQVKSLMGESESDMVELSEINEGQTFKIGDYEFIVLNQRGEFTEAIMKNLLEGNERFGSNNNYADSNVDKLCCDFGEKLAEIVGADNITPHIVNLTSDDGLKCYGSIERKVSLLTAEQYRKYVYILDEHKIDKWWWLATSYSTAKHNDTDWVKCVSPDGGINRGSCYFSGGVRPFCILKSNIFVSR